MQPFATERCYDRLHQSGWSVGEVSVATETGSVCLVTGTNGEAVIQARGATSAEAWSNPAGKPRP